VIKQYQHGATAIDDIVHEQQQQQQQQLTRNVERERTNF